MESSKEEDEGPPRDEDYDEAGPDAGDDEDADADVVGVTSRKLDCAQG